MNKIKLGVVLSLLLSLTSVYAEVSPETVVNIFQRIEALEKKTRELHGENEVLRHQISELKKSQKQGFLNIDERIDELANEAKPAPSEAETTKDDNDAKVKIIDKSEEDKKEAPAPVAKVTSTIEEQKASETSTKSTSDSAVRKKIRAPNSYERETYKAAFSLMKTSPSAATKAFQEYIKMQPESPLAANAQYWIGEVMYSHNNYKGAVQEFIKVLQKYKYSDKAPDAAIKLGYSFYALKNWKFARRTFEDVVKYFPENANAV
ncbi:MAG: tol-pal system protein YbgF, partial [Thiotrichaceae bacterium]|nr:tol-pal system protein YbgF [Thiotrichaceae bacterium]